MISSVVQYDQTYASYMLQCRRFLESLEAFEIKKVSHIIARIIICFSKDPEVSSDKVPAIITQLIDDGDHEQALIQVVSEYACFTVERADTYRFKFLDMRTGAKSNEIDSDANSFALALCSAYISWRLEQFNAGRNLSQNDLAIPVHLVHE